MYRQRIDCDSVRMCFTMRECCPDQLTDMRIVGFRVGGSGKCLSDERGNCICAKPVDWCGRPEPEDQPPLPEPNWRFSAEVTERNGESLCALIPNLKNKLPGVYEVYLFKGNKAISQCYEVELVPQRIDVAFEVEQGQPCVDCGNRCDEEETSSATSGGRFINLNTIRF